MLQRSLREDWSASSSSADSRLKCQVDMKSCSWWVWCCEWCAQNNSFAQLKLVLFGLLKTLTKVIWESGETKQSSVIQWRINYEVSDVKTPQRVSWPTFTSRMKHLCQGKARLPPWRVLVKIFYLRSERKMCLRTTVRMKMIVLKKVGWQSNQRSLDADSAQYLIQGTHFTDSLT